MNEWNKTVFVLGELNVDAIISGSNIHPEPNKEKFIDDFSITLGSSSAITACRLAQLGLNVYFVSVVGEDNFGLYCIERLKHFGVNTDFVRIDPDEKTGVTVSLSTPTDRSLLTYMGSIPKLTMPMVPSSLLELADHIHCGSFYLQQGMQQEWAGLFKRARERGISTSFDTGWDPDERWNRSLIDDLLQVTDLFLPSEEEALHIYGCSNLDDLNGIMSPKRGKVVVKCGRQGSRMLTEADAWQIAPGYEVAALDTTGAGDSFNAGVIFSYLKGKSHQEMLSFGNACGAISTLAIGGTGGTLDEQEVEAFISLSVPIRVRD